METRAERRRRKLRDLCVRHDGELSPLGMPSLAARRAVALAARVHPHVLYEVIKGVRTPKGTPKTLGDRAAERIEAAFKLGRGWFDADDLAAAPPPVTAPAMPVAPVTDSEWAVLDSLRELPQPVRGDLARKARELSDEWRALRAKHRAEEQHLTVRSTRREGVPPSLTTKKAAK